jgi:hypothetical protein
MACAGTCSTCWCILFGTVLSTEAALAVAHEPDEALDPGHESSVMLETAVYSVTNDKPYGS